jgi:hypothetical protein
MAEALAAIKKRTPGKKVTAETFIFAPNKRGHLAVRSRAVVCVLATICYIVRRARMKHLSWPLVKKTTLQADQRSDIYLGL